MILIDKRTVDTGTFASLKLPQKFGTSQCVFEVSSSDRMSCKSLHKSFHALAKAHSDATYTLLPDWGHTCSM